MTGDGFAHIVGLNSAINKRFGFSGIPLYCENGVLSYGRTCFEKYYSCGDGDGRGEKYDFILK